MCISNLEFLFRSTTFQPEDVRQYITSLLSKFEVALQFDDQHLILPSLLPVRHEPGSQRQMDTKVSCSAGSDQNVNATKKKPKMPVTKM